MRQELTIKTASLSGTSELTIIAPIKKGLVPSLDAMTYKTRVQHVLRLLHSGRTSLHDYHLARVLSDAVERVGSIHAVRIAVLEPEDKVLLTVTFDGTWESYVRVIWQKVSRLLDLIFCNTECYVLGWESSFEEWGRWLRQAQAETPFLYSTPGLTGDDYQYLQMLERWQRRKVDRDVDITRIRIPSSEEIADEMYKTGKDLTNMGLSEPMSAENAGRPAFRQGLASLVGLYRLADVYPPGTMDGKVLHRAGRELLPEFMRMIEDGTYGDGVKRALKRFPEPFEWLRRDIEKTPPVRQPPPLPEIPPVDDLADVQGGILRAYPGVDHGCLLLAAFKTPDALAAFLDALSPTTDADVIQPSEIYQNVGFTVEGLRLAGLSEGEIESFPEEFVQGMEHRAGVLGDVRVNHPRRWRLPALNWAEGVNATDPSEHDPVDRIDLSAVHIIVQLRFRSFDSSRSTPERAPSELAPRELLMQELERLVASNPDVVPLSLQWMDQIRDKHRHAIEHFGFRDGMSQPVLTKAEAGEFFFRNHVHVGEVLCGYANAADHAPEAPPAVEGIRGLLHNGSFLVVRKLRQDVGVLEAALQDAETETASREDGGPPLCRDDILAKMMGRWPAGHKKEGKPLVPVLDSNSNDFDFEEDRDGKQCPFHAHIRRANPRPFVPSELTSTMADGGRPARLFRRGMTYGPRHSTSPDDAKATAESLERERGLIFMAYNTSIGEQFEVIQRWLSGGNSSGSYSGQSDPFVGVAEPGRRRFFRFEHNDTTVRMALDGQDKLHAEPQPIVRLEWGSYFFVPSVSALGALCARARTARRAVLWSADEGERVILRLREIEARDGEIAALMAWKAALEDPEAAADFTSASIWAAIRECHGGVLRTPYGVLVASRETVDAVLRDENQHLTANGYLARMRRSFGAIYLGQDAEQEDHLYESESEVCNAAILDLDVEKAFTLARETTHKALNALVSDAICYAEKDEELRWEVTVSARELIDELLGKLSEEWFGLSTEGGFFCKDGFRWDWQEGQAPYYPGHFMAPSRYFFQAHPGPEVESMGSAHGRALRTAMDGFLARWGGKIKAPIARAVLDSELGKTDPAFVSRTLIGTIMGFVPLDGNLRRVFHEWLSDSSFWSLRARFAGDSARDYLTNKQRLLVPLTRALQLRGVPEQVWRTATVSHTIGTGAHQVAVRPGDFVVAAQVSAGQESLENCAGGIYHPFGGNREAVNAPTHACPGYGAAVAVMVGFLTALVESDQPLRAGPAPLTVSVEGRTPGVNKPAWDRTTFVYAEASATPIRLLMYGDSWLKEFFLHDSLVEPLHDMGYGSAFGTKFSWLGRRLVEMADSGLLGDVMRVLYRTPPHAILLGGGGNDIVHPTWDPKKSSLYRMLRQSPPTDQDPLIETEVEAFVDKELAGHYRKILDELVSAPTVPIVIHGYDHPIPDGTGRPWLKPIFVARGIHDPNRARDAMERLIDRLNSMIENLAKEYEAQYPSRVHYVKLTGTLKANYGDPANYKKLWKDELHANEDGFKLLAAEVAKKLKELDIT
jgi:Dyp-type peroxidase family